MGILVIAISRLGTARNAAENDVGLEAPVRAIGYIAVARRTGDIGFWRSKVASLLGVGSVVGCQTPVVVLKVRYRGFILTQQPKWKKPPKPASIASSS